MNDEEATSTSVKTVTQDDHNGTGSVDGDMDLVAENFKKDVVIFGVTGTFEGDSGGAITVPKTGQAMSFQTGGDGDVEMGVAWPDPRFTDHGDRTVPTLIQAQRYRSERLPFQNHPPFCRGLLCL
ncbi:MAG: hypothetical protein PHO14_09365 [Kiritimatiellae bacterium]|nr:hypothetical protein [Kiritimatiellia bacterium]MDD4342424.1 hypothetical protein [Kiritimatiellia bacterium]